MDLNEIKKVGEILYAPVFSFESFFPNRVRKNLEMIFRFVFIISFSVFVVVQILKRFMPDSYLVLMKSEVNGVTALVFVVWIFIFLLQCFYNSYYYSNIKTVKGVYIDFDLSFAIKNTSLDDITKSFFKSDLGKIILLRCGIDSDSFNRFLFERREIVSSNNFKCLIKDNRITLKDFAGSIFDQDKLFRNFLFGYGIQKNDISGIAEWIMDSNSSYRDNSRWWSKDNLLRFPSIGQNWSYGQIYNLKQYERPIIFGSGHYRIRTTYGLEEGRELESVLLRRIGANVILVGNDESGKFHIVYDLYQRIYEGLVLSELKNKRMVLFDDDLMIARNGSKEKFEFEFIKIMNQAVSAGNVILVFDDFPGFISSAKTIGVDLPSLIEPYLVSKSLQVIALSDIDRFHSLIERNIILSQHFENVLIKEIDNSNSIKVIENEVSSFEKKGMFFTYPAVVSIVDGAEKYFSDGVMPDKAIDLLLEVVPKLQSQGKNIVESKDIVSLLEIKTGIPMGKVDEEEKDKLLNLESILSKKIIGQNEAVVAISNAVRRARSGINNPNRPMGSFLFLGSTGVGKTETTKALAEVFFGEEANILRLDMSEYSGFDSVSKLIGSFDGEDVGTLSAMLREHPYGVLLLDEFEKTTKEVMNLFLQILDEGFFSDSTGKKVNARNLIIIATSNAGSQIIWEKQKNGEDLLKAKEEIVESIIDDKVFKPELINRFDGVILFHPLDEISLNKIAELMLYKLHNRLADKGIDLVVNQDLIDFVSQKGSDPKFGARPMNRFIQERVEEVIAKKIISGVISNGEKVVLTREDLVQ